MSRSSTPYNPRINPGVSPTQSIRSASNSLVPTESLNSLTPPTAIRTNYIQHPDAESKEATQQQQSNTDADAQQQSNTDADPQPLPTVAEYARLAMHQYVIFHILC